MRAQAAATYNSQVETSIIEVGMQTKSKSLVALIAGAVLLASITGCSAARTPDQGEPVSNAAGMPEFQGNFAAEYQEAWEKSKTETVRAILQDETISDQEWSQVLKKLEACLEEGGISLTEYKPDGSYEVNVGEMNGEAANQKMGGCEEESGEAWIGHLYRSQTSNPENIPATQLLTECLVRNGVVPSSYTEEQYLVDAPELTFPFVDEHGFETLDLCTADFNYTK